MNHNMHSYLWVNSSHEIQIENELLLRGRTMRDSLAISTPFRFKMNGSGLELNRIDGTTKSGRSVPLVRQLDVHLELFINR